MSNTPDRTRTCIRGIRNPLPRPLGYESSLCEKLPISHIIRTPERIRTSNKPRFVAACSSPLSYKRIVPHNGVAAADSNAFLAGGVDIFPKCSYTLFKWWRLSTRATSHQIITSLHYNDGFQPSSSPAGTWTQTVAVKVLGANRLHHEALDFLPFFIRILFNFWHFLGRLYLLHHFLTALSETPNWHILRKNKTNV